MSALENAKKLLEGDVTIVLVKDDDVITSQLKGIRPLMNLLRGGKDLTGYVVADKIIGKAQAMLIIKARVKEAFGKVVSVSGKEIMEKNGVKVTYETLTDKIINRNGTDICPMEKAVQSIDDIEEGYRALIETVKKLCDGNKESG